LCRSRSEISNPAKVIRNSRKKRAPTIRVNTVNVRHLTLEFVDGTYQSVPRKDMTENSCENDDVANANAVSAIIKNESFGTEDNLTITTENSTKLY